MMIDLKLINGLSACRGFEFEQATGFIESCRVVHVKQGDVVTPPPNGIVFIRDGELEQIVSDAADSLVLRTLSRGDQIWTSELVGSTQRSGTTLRARNRGVVLELDGAGLAHLVRKNHPVVGKLEVEGLRTQAMELGSRISVLGRCARAEPQPSAPGGLTLAFRGLLRSLRSWDQPLAQDTTTSPVLQRRLGMICTPVDHLVAALGDRIDRRAVEIGDILATEGEAGQRAFVVQTGRVARLRRTPDGKQVRLGTVGPGQLGGFVPSIIGGCETSTCVALDKGEVLWLRKADLTLALIERTPEARAIRLGMLATLSQWLDDTAWQLLAEEGRRRAAADEEVTSPTATHTLRVVSHSKKQRSP